MFAPTARALLIAAVMAGLGCTTTDPYTGEQKTSNTAKGAGVGAAAGAVLGAAVSSKDDRAKGAAIGAAVGAGIGGGIGNYMDRQEAALRQRLEGTGVRVRRTGDELTLVMPSNITFDTDEHYLKSSFEPVLESVALVVEEFDQTLLEIKGYTDSTGSFEHNQKLSERRAASVADFLVRQGVSSSRIRSNGYGERHPIASNDTAAGRAQNRRVEIDLQPIKQ